MEGKKILITGASGQCGLGLSYVLAKKNEVHALARFSKPERREALAAAGCRIWTVDMGKETPPKALPKDFDIVIHEAVSWAEDEGPTSLREQNESFDISCRFVGDLMYRSDRAAFALISTGSVYTRTDTPCKEDETPVRGGPTYVSSKIAMTQLARWVGRTFGRHWVELRYWFPFAPYQSHEKMECLIQGKLYAPFPAGIHQRTYVKNHIDNTIKALAFAKPEGEVFNSATTEWMTNAQLAQLGARITGVEPEAAALAPVEPHIGSHVADTAKLQRLIGPSSISMAEGFRRYLRGQREKITTPQDWMFEEETK